MGGGEAVPSAGHHDFQGLAADFPDVVGCPGGERAGGGDGAMKGQAVAES